MKKKLTLLLILPVLLVCLATSFNKKGSYDLSAYYVSESDELVYFVPTESEAVVFYPEESSFTLSLGKTFIGFKEALAFKESQGRYGVVNVYGYLGKYQFAKNTLKLLGVYDAQQFINSSKLQEDAFLAYTARNKWILRRDIKRYNGTIINGVKITESGILAAAHLAGAGNVKKYLRSKGTYHFSDAFGTTIDHYLKRFAGYDTSFIKANKHAIAAR